MPNFLKPSHLCFARMPLRQSIGQRWPLSTINPSTYIVEMIANDFSFKPYYFFDDIILGNNYLINSYLRPTLWKKTLEIFNEEDLNLGEQSWMSEIGFPVLKSKNTINVLNLKEVNIVSIIFHEPIGTWVLECEEGKILTQEVVKNDTDKNKETLHKYVSSMCVVKPLEHFFIATKNIHLTSYLNNIPYIEVVKSEDGFLQKNKVPSLHLWGGSKIITQNPKALLQVILKDLEALKLKALL